MCCAPDGTPDPANWTAPAPGRCPRFRARELRILLSRLLRPVRRGEDAVDGHRYPVSELQRARHESRACSGGACCPFPHRRCGRSPRRRPTCCVQHGPSSRTSARPASRRPRQARSPSRAPTRAGRRTPATATPAAAPGESTRAFFVPLIPASQPFLQGFGLGSARLVRVIRSCAQRA